MHAIRQFYVAILCFAVYGQASSLLSEEPSEIHHSYLVMGAKTAIIDEAGKPV